MSMAPLLGLPGKIKTLLDRLTATRAGNLDNLDAAISSRAPASTALSTSQWTPTRAGYLDRLDAAVTSRLATAVESVQSGVVAADFTAGTNGQHDITISSVDVNKAVVLVAGFSKFTGSASTAHGCFGGYLTSATNLRLHGFGDTGDTTDARVVWQVVEYK